MSAGRSTNHESRKRKKMTRERVKNLEAQKRDFFYRLKLAWRAYWNEGGPHPSTKGKR